jgi:AraC-like DNA-binding protein
MLLRPRVFRSLCQARDLLAGLQEENAPSITEVARQVAISPAHFTRQFEAVFGATPHQFRIRSRLGRAQQLLAAGQHSVTEVCMEVGFSSLGSFSDLFHRRFGESPSAYQRRLRPFISVPGPAWAGLFPGCLGLMAGLPAGAFRSFREAGPALGGQTDRP